VAPAWGSNPAYSYKAGATADLTQFAFTKAKFDFTVVNPNGNTYAVGNTISLQDLISFTNGPQFTQLTEYVVASHTNTATDGTSFEISRFNISAPSPIWAIVTGFQLGNGNFTINGGPGDDIVSVNGPNGMAYGGAGNDTYWYTPVGNGEKYTIDDASGTSDALTAQVFDGYDVIPRAERIGNDLKVLGTASNMANARSTLYITNQYTTGTIENLNLMDPRGDIQRTYKFAVTDTGSDANEFMAGNALNNLISGGAGDDMLFGADGNDTLSGDNGDDQLYGGAGTNLLQGGLGNDTYQWDIAGGTTTDSVLDSGGTDGLLMRLPSLMLDAERSGNDVLVSVISSTMASMRR
jgi:Ca2+-binding RTX toxin-like protein